MSAPEPSPAFTIDYQPPGFYPPTPASEDLPTSPSFADPNDSQDQDALLARAALEPVTTLPSTLDTVEHAIAGAASGLLAKVGELAGVPAPEVDGLDDLTRNLEPHHDDDTAATGSPASAKTLTLAGDDSAPVDETHRPEFGLDAVRKEQDDLAASPAQQLVADAQDDDADGKHTGAKLAAGGAGALGGAALLAGAAGAKNEGNEVREPTVEDDAAERNGLVEPTHAQSTPTSAAPDYGTPAIEKEQAALAASPAQQLLRADTASSSTAIHRDEAALLAGAAGAKLGATHEVEEPAKAPVDVATDKAVEAGAGVPQSPHSEALEREISEPVAPLSSSTAAADSTSRPSLPTPHGSTTSFSADVLAAGDGIHTPTEAPGPAAGGFGMRGDGDIVATDHELDEGSARGIEGGDVVHNPAPALPALAVVGSAAALTQDVPKDFQPYTPPVAEPTQASVELQQAAAVPVPVTPAAELPPTADLARVDSRSTSHTVMPSTATGALDPSATSVPETLNAQNLDTTTPAVPSPAPAPASPGSEQIEMDEALDEGPVMEKRDKGKGKEVLGAAALGTAGVGAGVGMKELLDGDKQTNATTAHPDSLDDQRAFPTTPHMLDSTSPIVAADGAAPRALDPATAGHGQSGSAAVAGPTVAAGAQGMTPAMAELAHLSEPASGAHAPLTTEQPLVEQPISAAEYEDQKEAHREGDGHGVPLAAAGAGLAGIGAGAAGANLLARRNEPHAPIAVGAPSALSPVAAAPVAATPVQPETVEPVAAVQPVAAAAEPVVHEPVVEHPRAVEQQPSAAPVALAATPAVLAAGAAAPAAATIAAVDANEPQQQQQQQHPPLDNKRTPVSRFTEETFTPSATGAETPSSTRAVMGSPPTSAAATPLQSTTPTQSLFEAGILEKSPHMKIQTHKVDGHKRLHRKSLSGVVSPVGSISRRTGSGESPRGSPRQSVETERALPQQQQQLGAANAAVPGTVAVAGATPMLVGGGPQAGQVRRAPSAVNQEGRRDRMVNNMVGVQDPTIGGYDAPNSARSAPVSPTMNVAQVSPNAGGAQTYAGLPPTGSAAAVYAPGTGAGAPPRAAQQQQQYYAPPPSQQQPQFARPPPPQQQQQVIPPQHQHAVAQHPVAHQQQPHHAQQIPTHSATTTTVDSHGREHRKLQKKHAPAGAVGGVNGGAVAPGSTASSEEKKSGFLSRVFGGGSK
ncbi:uncharacterized protein RHOBADRAFT_52256 [Rhodotorula graminis WP1]|uniref:Uncharacterized protein n=1 Tax=Rhodotorula graminis (strain WP1) TaxID=578459 RepID=A0A194S661_RHOGW|nr:uncharacterized protein RHOBADRAFT_52256 [Rhodotorula graminis WP1]KPV76218.1 hypothetical protein RHOBADRAFT_52256 [Rhodotorula graminis WP1]